MSNDPSILDIILSKFDKLDERLDRFEQNQSEANITLAKQEVSLSEHIKRTNLLEKKLEPVERHVQVINAILKAIGGIAVVITIISGLIKIIEAIH